MTTTPAHGTDAPTARVPDFPMDRAAGCPFDPPPDLRTLQSQAPISRVRSATCHGPTPPS